jgi:hypothetical protein
MLITTIVLLLAVPLIEAAPSTCTAVPSVSSCVKAINATLTKTKSASSFCSSVLKCTTTPTITLTGKITITSTKTIVQTYTFEELVRSPSKFVSQWLIKHLGLRDHHDHHFLPHGRKYTTCYDRDFISCQDSRVGLKSKFHATYS